MVLRLLLGRVQYTAELTDAEVDAPANHETTEVTQGLRIAAVFIILSAGLLGGVPPLFIRAIRNQESLATFLIRAFSAGVILALALVHIVPDAIADLEGIGGTTYPIGGTSILFGIAAMVFIEHGAHLMYGMPHAHAANGQRRELAHGHEHGRIGATNGGHAAGQEEGKEQEEDHRLKLLDQGQQARPNPAACSGDHHYYHNHQTPEHAVQHPHYVLPAREGPVAEATEGPPTAEATEQLLAAAGRQAEDDAAFAPEGEAPRRPEAGSAAVLDARDGALGEEEKERRGAAPGPCATPREGGHGPRQGAAGDGRCAHSHANTHTHLHAHTHVQAHAHAHGGVAGQPHAGCTARPAAPASPSSHHDHHHHHHQRQQLQAQEGLQGPASSRHGCSNGSATAADAVAGVVAAAATGAGVFARHSAAPSLCHSGGGGGGFAAVRRTLSPRASPACALRADGEKAAGGGAAGGGGGGSCHAGDGSSAALLLACPPDHCHDCVSRSSAPNWASAMEVTASGASPLRLRILAYLFELGCIFHSFIIGLSLGVNQTSLSQVRALLLALSFHQALEGLSLASVINRGGFPPAKAALMVAMYSITCPAGVAIGIAIAASYDPESLRARAAQGVLNGVSGGMLLYISLVQLVAEDMGKYVTGGDGGMEHEGRDSAHGHGHGGGDAAGGVCRHGGGGGGMGARVRVPSFLAFCAGAASMCLLAVWA